MTANLIGTPIGHPIASHRVYPNRGRIAPIVSARVDPSMSYGSLSSGEMSLASHPCLGDPLPAANAALTLAVGCDAFGESGRWSV